MALVIPKPTRYNSLKCSSHKVEAHAQYSDQFVGPAFHNTTAYDQDAQGPSTGKTLMPNTPPTIMSEMSTQFPAGCLNVFHAVIK